MAISFNIIFAYFLHVRMQKGHKVRKYIQDTIQHIYKKKILGYIFFLLFFKIYKFLISNNEYFDHVPIYSPSIVWAQEQNANKIYLKIQNRTDDTLHYDYACAV